MTVYRNKTIELNEYCEANSNRWFPRTYFNSLNDYVMIPWYKLMAPNCGSRQYREENSIPLWWGIIGNIIIAPFLIVSLPFMLVLFVTLDSGFFICDRFISFGLYMNGFKKINGKWYNSIEAKYI